MKKLCLFFILSGLLTFSLYAESNIVSVQIKLEPIFHGMGFSFKGTVGEYTVTEIHLAKVHQTNLSGGKEDTAPTFTGKLIFGDNAYQLKLINPKLDQFEADVMGNDAKADQNAGLAVPVGHVTFKLAKPDKNHSVAGGRLLLKTEDKDASGEFSLLLNELPLPPAPGNNPGNPQGNPAGGQPQGN